MLLCSATEGTAAVSADTRPEPVHTKASAHRTQSNCLKRLIVWFLCLSENLVVKVPRLYEQKRSGVLAVTALEMYVRRWVRWANGGLVISRAARLE